MLPCTQLPRDRRRLRRVDWWIRGGDLQGSGIVCEIAMPAQLTDAPMRSLNGMIDLYRPPRFALCGWLAGAHGIRHPRVGR